MSDLPPGSQFGPYRIEHELGRGGMSIVYLAMEDSLSRTIALKIMAPHLHVDDSYRRRFNSEARAAAAISHPNIVPIYSFGEQADRLYIAMQYINGTDFRKYLEQWGPLEPATAANIVEQAAWALDAVHARGMTHRDIKPDNILLTATGGDAPHVYVADFGLTRAEGDEHLTSTGQILGTVTYASPEQLLGEPVDGRADIYSLACVLFQAVTGSPPFVKNGSTAVIYAHVSEDPPAARERNASLPTAIDEVLAKGLAKKPEDRYQTASEMVTAFRQAGARTAPNDVPRPSGPLPTQAPIAYSSIDPASVPGSEPSGPSPVFGATDAASGSPTPTPAPLPAGSGTSPPPGSPGRGRTMVIIGAAALLIIVVAALGLFVSRQGGNVVTSQSAPTVGTAASPTSEGSSESTTSSEEGTTTTMNPKLAQILQGIDTQLVELKRLHTRLGSTFDGVAERCKITPEDAVNRVDAALTDYEHIVNALKELEEAGNAEGEDLANDLRVAVERTMTTARDLRAWLQGAIAANPTATPPGCPDGIVPQDDTSKKAEQENVQALSLKTDFATRYGSISPNSVDPNEL